MKDLEKNVVYDLSDLNDDELNKVLTWIVKNDKGWSACTCRYLKGKYIKFEIDSEQRVFYNGYENLINAKTLFDPKVNIINPTESNCDENIEKDSILEVIIKNRIIAIEETKSELENLLLHNTNLNDYSKTEIMKNITFINRQSDVLNEVLKDYELEKLKQQCEN